MKDAAETFADRLVHFVNALGWGFAAWCVLGLIAGIILGKFLKGD